MISLESSNVCLQMPIIITERPIKKTNVSMINLTQLFIQLQETYA